jgi:hypothetical protein
VPIVEDKLALRVSAFTRRDPAYLDNINAKAGRRRHQQEPVKGGRVALLFKPTDIFTIDLSAMRQRANFFGSPQVRICPSCGTGAFQGSPISAGLRRPDAEPRARPSATSTSRSIRAAPPSTWASPT